MNFLLGGCDVTKRLEKDKKEAASNLKDCSQLDNDSRKDLLPSSKDFCDKMEASAGDKAFEKMASDEDNGKVPITRAKRVPPLKIVLNSRTASTEDEQLTSTSGEKIEVKTREKNEVKTREKAEAKKSREVDDAKLNEKEDNMVSSNFNIKKRRLRSAQPPMAVVRPMDTPPVPEPQNNGPTVSPPVPVTFTNDHAVPVVNEASAVLEPPAPKISKPLAGLEPETSKNNKPSAGLESADDSHIPMKKRILRYNDIDRYVDLRKQVEQRRKNVFPVCPKPPEGFKDYLMNRKSYLLQENAHERYRSTLR